MDQSKFAPCTACMNPIPPGHKFCGRCGEVTPEEALEIRTRYFGALQEPNRANLVVIRGRDLDGVSYHLRASEHELGREAQIQIDDTTLDPQHARFVYQLDQLKVVDEGSLNGIYARIDGGVKLQVGDCFNVGDQFFQILEKPDFREEEDAEGTTFYGSPSYESPYQVEQILARGQRGLRLCPKFDKIVIGRAGCDINLFSDPHVSLEHCSLERDADGFSLIDLDSDNGTYIRIKNERSLEHGDYLRIGQSILRIEINA